MEATTSSIHDMTNATSHPGNDKPFGGSIPAFYEKYMVPLIFAPYAADMAGRLSSRSDGDVLEVAAGTGVVTRKLASLLPASVSIVATDLSQPMLDLAESIGTTRPVQWRRADAVQLPFADNTFDAVVCQFGVMFFADRSRAFAEVRRVLRPGGVFIFSVWDRIEQNEFVHIASTAVGDLFPADPPRFMERTPHGYYDHQVIARDLVDGGFTDPAEFETIAARSLAESARIPAVAYCQGTPLRNEIEARDHALLEVATERVAEAIARRFGPGPIEGKIQAHFVTVQRHLEIEGSGRAASHDR